MNDNSWDKGKEMLPYNTGISKAKETPINLDGGIDSAVLWNLRNINRRCSLTINITDQDVINQMIRAYTRDFEVYWKSNCDKKKLRELDQEIQNITRFIDFCFELEYDIQAYFNNRFYQNKTPEQVIKTFREFIRCTIVIILEELGRPEIAFQLKISSLRRSDTDEIWMQAKILALRTLAVTMKKRDNSCDELYSVIVLFKECLRNENK